MSAWPYLLHGTTLAFAWFLLFNLAASACVALLTVRLTKRVAVGSPGLWLAVRLSPAALSMVFVAAIFLPSYWRYEPRELVEGFDVTLTTFAVIAISVVAAAIVQGAAAWRRAQRRTDAWMRVARPLVLPGTAMPAFAVDADAPVMALVGLLRPRLFIMQPILDALTVEELHAAVAHELGHRRAWDNLKRLAMRAAPDLLSATSASRALERRWAAASEHVADRAAGDSGRARCALASALVKVARMTPPATSFTEPISTLVDGGDITARVRCLLDDAPAPAERRPLRSFAFAIPALAFVLAYAPLLRLIHAVTELLVSTLP